MNPRKTPSFFLAALAAITLTAALPMGAMAENINTVTVTKFHQSYPYSGKATVEFTVSGTLPANAAAEITLSTDDASATFTQNNVVTGANTFTIDFASSFGGALALTNASFVVTITRDIGGVQLWEGGPYWAECNLGASKPEEYGYYFWWGDTVGYTPIGGTWTDDDWSVVPGVTWVSSTGEQMSSSPFSSSSCPTRNKDDATLQSEGYIDSTGNLVAAHDAATAHLGSPWRLPTDAEISALVGNCTATWITTNGVHGLLVTGKGVYANRSIFLPAAGFGYDSSLYYPGSEGNCRSSTPLSGYPNDAWHLNFDSISFRRSSAYRHYGQSVRPARRFAECSTFGIVTYDYPYEIWAAANGISGEWDETDELGIHNVFRYAFDKPVGAFADPPILDIAIEDGNAVVKTPPVVNAASFTVSVVESSDVAGATVTARKLLDATGRAVFAMESAPSRFYRLSATSAKTGVQLWANGPYWATTNIGAERPEESGWYFWWGDTVGYKRERDAWVATDGSSSNFQFVDDPISQQTSNKGSATLLSEGWIVSRNGTYVLAPEHDAAYVKWGGNWRMPTKLEQSYLGSKCDWTWVTTNGVNGYVVRGRGDYASNSIFLPAAGGADVNGGSLGGFGKHGRYWSSVPYAMSNGTSWALHFMSDSHDADDYYGRGRGYSVRPVRDAD